MKKYRDRRKGSTEEQDDANDDISDERTELNLEERTSVNQSEVRARSSCSCTNCPGYCFYVKTIHRTTIEQ